MPYLEPSRPIPDCLTPPNGAASLAILDVALDFLDRLVVDQRPYGHARFGAPPQAQRANF